MSNISQIKVPAGTTYDISDKHKSGIYTVIGTQTGVTGSWTGALHGVSALYNGLTINYYLPYNGSGNATLNLTLDDGSTTGPINCYITTGRLTTHYGAGRSIVMTYYSAGSIKISGTATTDNRWICDSYYDTTDITTLQSTYSRPLTGTNGIKQYGLFARTGDLTYDAFTTNNGTGTKTKTSLYYDISKIFYASINDNVAANTNIGTSQMRWSMALVDLRYTFNGVSTTASASSITANKPVYLVFNKTSNNKGMHQLADTWYTHTLPTTADNKIYVLIGFTYDSYRMDLWIENPAFYHDGTNVKPYNNATTVGGYTIATTSVGSASAGTAFTVPTAFNTTAVPNISKKTVVTSASGATASYANGILTITNGSFGTGDSVTVGTAINAYTSVKTNATIPNISVTSKTVATAT